MDEKVSARSNNMSLTAVLPQLMVNHAKGVSTRPQFQASSNRASMMRQSATVSRWHWSISCRSSRRSMVRGVAASDQTDHALPENLPQPLDRPQHLLLLQPRPVAAHHEMIDAERLAIACDFLLHERRVADNE